MIPYNMPVIYASGSIVNSISGYILFYPIEQRGGANNDHALADMSEKVRTGVAAAGEKFRVINKRWL